MTDPTQPDATGYDERKERSRAREAVQSLSGRDIGDMPEVVNPKRRAACEFDFRLYCETYHPAIYTLPWSPDHLRVIRCIEVTVLEGGLQAFAMPRGSGKTSLCETAVEWGLLYGHSKFACMIGATEKHAEAMLDSIKHELEQNDILLEDFPGICYPIRCLDGIANRCAGQLYAGQRTLITWTGKELVFPSIEGVAGSGGIVSVAGITGRVRGQKMKMADGSVARPDIAIVDDPQTDESARSLSQCDKRERVIAGAVLGLPKPGTKISAFMPCTVIAPGDMADRLLNRDLHPDWRGERTKMLNAFPTNAKLWDEYAEVRADGLRASDSGAAANAFYAEHREAMDEGAQVAWPERHNADELSGLQHAMNLKFRDEPAFYAEYQNDPLPPDDAATRRLLPDDVARKLNGRKRGEVSAGVEHVTAFIDLHATVLYWVVCGWRMDFTGYVLDYGTWPEQGVTYFRQRDVRRTLSAASPGAGVEGAVYAGLETLVGELMSREWPRDDGAVLRMSRIGIDQGWQAPLVHQFCRQSVHAATLQPQRGAGITAANRPISEYDRKRGDRIGHHWWIPNVRGRQALRHLEVDTNYWKTCIHERLGTAMGDRGCLSTFGSEPGRHRLFAEHMTAEYAVATEGRGRRVEEWFSPAYHPDNHWFDCVVGCAALASMLGAIVPGMLEAPGVPQPQKPIRLSEIQAQRRAERAKPIQPQPRREVPRAGGADPTVGLAESRQG